MSTMVSPFSSGGGSSIPAINIQTDRITTLRTLSIRPEEYDELNRSTTIQVPANTTFFSQLQCQGRTSGTTSRSASCALTIPDNLSYSVISTTNATDRSQTLVYRTNVAITLTVSWSVYVGASASVTIYSIESS